MKKQILTLILGLSLLTFGLKAQEHDHSKMDMKDHEGMTMHDQMPQEFQAQLANVYNASLQLKDAFVASDPKQVKKKAESVRKAISKVDVKLLKGDAHMQWMDHLKTLNSSLHQISEAGNIADQRKSFAGFSESLYKSIKAFGIGGEEAYYQYCPMANNNQGAYWLSDNKEIRNPYLGEKMMTCGVVKETVK